MFKFLNLNQKGYDSALEFCKIPASKLTPLMLCETFSAPVLLEERFNLVEHRLFCCIVGSSELLGALEHEVLEVVGKTRGL